MWDSDKQTWFDNPPRRKRRRKLYGAAAKAHARKMRKHPKRKGARKVAKRRGHRRKLYGAAAKAHARRMARGGHKRSHRRRASSSHRRRSTGRRRHYRRSTARAASRAGRTLRYRRPNPPLKGLVGELMDGLKDAALVTGGKAATNIIAGFIPLSGGTAMETAKRLAAALAAGYGGRFISRNASRMFLIGGLTGVVEGLVKQLNIPVLAPALSDYYDPGYLAVGSYVQQVPAGVSSYPQLLPGGGMSGVDEDEVLFQ